MLVPASQTLGCHIRGDINFEIMMLSHVLCVYVHMHV